MQFINRGLIIATFALICAPVMVALMHNRHIRSIFKSAKIVGGGDTDIEQAPYQIQLNANGGQICGGSIVTKDYILTAIHCTIGYPACSLNVRSGTNHLNQGGVLTDVAEVFQNPNYNCSTMDPDISILKLANSLTFDRTTQPVHLALKEPQAGDIVLITGWGKLAGGPNGKQPNQLQEVTVLVVERDECNADYDRQITENMFCASAEGKDSCQGDSGGPVVTIKGVQVGIVSWGYGCALKGYPGVYTNIAKLRQFIDEHTNREVTWSN